MSVVTTTAMKVAPSAAAGLSVATGSTSWVNGSWVEVLSSTAGLTAIAGFTLAATNAGQWQFDIGVGGAGSEVVVGTVGWTNGNSAQSSPANFSLPYPLGGIGSGV